MLRLKHTQRRARRWGLRCSLAAQALWDLDDAVVIPLEKAIRQELLDQVAGGVVLEELVILLGNRGLELGDLVLALELCLLPVSLTVLGLGHFSLGASALAADLAT